MTRTGKRHTGGMRMLPLNTAMAAMLWMGSVLPVFADTRPDEVWMYRNGDRNAPATIFSPTDIIGVRLRFKALSEGAYTLHADWYNPAGTLQERSRYRFHKQKDCENVIESQLELIKASPLRRLFSASEATGYHMKFYGRWQVVFFLNGEEIVRLNFEVR